MALSDATKGTWLRARMWWGSATVLLVLAIWTFGPWGDPDLASHPNPAVDYQAAVDRIEMVKASEDGLPVADRGRSFALLQGSRVETAVVVLHGYTSSPKAFALIAQAYADAGCNVWVPRQPAHGYRDYLSEEHASLTAVQVRDYADDAVDIAAGLGDNVVVVGQSAGGALSMWALEERPEVVHAVAISPFLHPKSGLPVWQMRPLGRLSSLGLLRGMWRWWDPKLKGSPMRQAIDPNAYPRGSVNAILQYLTIGRWLGDTRVEGPRPAGTLTLVVNEHDPDIDGPYNEALARALLGDEQLTVLVVPDSAGIGHDMCDPEGVNRARMRMSFEYLGRALGLSLPDPLVTP